MAMRPVLDHLGFEVTENYHSRAIQQYLSNIGEKMPLGTWEVCVCNSRESRVGKGLGVPYRSNSSDVNGYAFLGRKKKDIFKSKQDNDENILEKLTYK